MTNLIPYRKNSSRLLLIEFVKVCRSAWVVVVPLSIALTRVEGAWHTAVTVSLGYYVYTRVYRIAGDWVAVRYKCDTHSIVFQKGRLFGTQSSIPWVDVRSVSVNASPLEAAFRRERVTIAIESASDSIVLAALTRREADRIRRLFEKKDAHRSRMARGLTASSASVITQARKGQVLTKQLRLPDHILIGFTHGFFFLVVPLAVTLPGTLREYAGIDALDLPGFDGVQGYSAFVTVMTCVGVAMLAVIYGTFLSWARFRQYRVVRQGAFLTFSGGIRDRERKTVAVNDVSLLEAKQNTLMWLSRRVQIRCLTGEATASVSRNMLLPLETLPEARRLVQRFFPDFKPLVEPRASVGFAWPTIGLCGVLLAPLGAIVGSQLHNVPGLESESLGWLTTIAVLGLLVPVINRHTGSVTIDVVGRRTIISARAGIFWRRTVTGSIHSFHSIGTWTGPLGKHLRVSRMTFCFRDRFTRRVVVRMVPITTAQQIAEALRGPTNNSYDLAEDRTKVKES